MKARFPESKEEKAARLAQIVRQVAGGANALESAQSGLPSLSVLEERIARQLEAADADAPAAMVKAVAAKKAQDGHAIAERLARGEIVPADLNEESFANLEAVIRVTGRPAWFVRNDVPQTQEAASTQRADEFWITIIAAAKKALWAVCGRTGCVMKQEDGSRVPVGTGWMIGERTLVTNAHVAGHLARRRQPVPAGDARNGWRLRPDIGGLVDFAFENGENRTSSFEVADVLYVETAEAPDIAIFRLRIDDNGAKPPEPIALDLTAARPAGWTDTNVFAVGHPMADLNDDANVAMVFGKLDSTKRISPGKLMDVLGNEVLTHDCSTTNGSSGSPLIDFASLKAVGLHYFGKPGERNEAVFLPAIASHPAIVNSLSGQWGI